MVSRRKRWRASQPSEEEQPTATRTGIRQSIAQHKLIACELGSRPEVTPDHLGHRSLSLSLRCECSPSSVHRMAEASSSSQLPSSAVLLTSISPVDPSKQRTFTARYYTQPASSTPSTSSADLPDSYFQPTAQELQRAHAHAISHREHLVDRPLLTSKLRDQQRADKQRTKAAKFPKTTIRIRFHGGQQGLLEGEFNSATDKLIHVYEFVKLALQPRLRHVPFLLYQTPPRQEYRRDDPALRGKSLLDLDFAPSTSLYLKFLPPPPSSPEVDVDTLNATTTSPSEFLIPELIQAATELPRPPSFDPTTTSDTGSEASPPTTSEEQKKKDKEERLRKLLGGGGGGKGGMFGGGGGGGKSEFFLFFPSGDAKRPLSSSLPEEEERKKSHRSVLLPQMSRKRRQDIKGS